ncbi:hypothetical protein FisN_11Lh046 [Fistulifera solaris]|uniref:Uncharacterized protein n=1 Tax=Fistulifera solaris TaxID=1519565 RepID=A0A1Z5J7J1_FISSO|nr:hypothetical protein FisN_11Lh046 [Fistulifera solaris]|eukprot:GAX09965.1 hypothetical protein FisN_11Lh046 [Fistulifera solaris]
MTESFLERVANDMLEASEKLVNGVEEGLAILFSSESQTAEETPPPQSVAEEWDDETMAEEFVLQSSSPLSGIAESVMGNILQGQQTPQTFMEHFHAFRYAITWSEPFVIGLIAFQAIMLLLTLWVSRKNQSLAPRVILMLLILGLVRLAERWNELGARHWRSFATQNYFDRHGIFVSIMLCAPLLFDSLIMMILFLREASQLLVEVKAAQIKRKQKAAKKQSKKDQ